MAPIRKHIILDERNEPFAVQLSMDDWKRIEPLLKEKGILDSVEDEEQLFDSLLVKTQGIWSQGDGLTYQLSLREEWGSADSLNSE